MPNSQVRGSERVVDMWTKKGSWVLLAGVALSMFMAGSGFQAYMYTSSLQTQQDSYDKKEELYRTRIRELNDELKGLTPKVQLAADKATEAADAAQSIVKEAKKQ